MDNKEGGKAKRSGGSDYFTLGIAFFPIGIALLVSTGSWAAGMTFLILSIVCMATGFSKRGKGSGES
ncbi:hypothetical protein ACXZ66_08235 [Corynebacterium sp. S7]